MTPAGISALLGVAVVLVALFPYSIPLAGACWWWYRRKG
jgi:hypothetical protein